MTVSERSAWQLDDHGLAGRYAQSRCAAESAAHERETTSYRVSIRSSSTSGCRPSKRFSMKSLVKSA